jgi:eukaryotic-like serine/threonine-protein kinase
MIGTRLGPYEITAKLGEGGMGEVYRATDSKLKREVAVKVLPAAFTEDPARLARFEREAQLLAQLQHPNIAAIYGLEESSGVHALVMELVEGPTLAERLAAGPLQFAEALRIARHIAEALEEAHDKGIIHRDLKPQNIKAAPDGKVKLLDFGLAKALDPAGGAVAPDSANSPTMTGPPGSAPGVILGTAAYMSPEQARGGAVDKRADIWAFGVVLYEMLTGERLFQGESSLDTLAAVIGKELDLARLPGATPARLRELLRHCLERNPKNRLHDMADARLELEEALQRPGGEAPAAAGKRKLSPWLVGTAAAVTLTFVLVGLVRSSRPKPAPGTDAPKRIAVLPFENLGSPDDDYFVDGITDEVRSRLTSLAGLQVIARASSNQYRKTEKSPRQIGEELGVDYLLTGTVRFAGDAAGARRVQVSPELSEIATASSKWAQPYDAALTDVFQVQGEIAAKVAQELDVALSKGSRASLKAMPTRNLAAYEAYLRGEEASQAMSVSDPPSLRRAIDYYEQAVALDAGFLEAWARLSTASTSLYFNSIPTPALALRAKDAAERALTLDPERPEGHKALADYYRSVVKEPARALREAERARALAPGGAEYIAAVATVEQSLGNWEVALTHLEQASRLDPRSVNALRRLGTTTLYLRRARQARQVCDAARALAPTNPIFIELLAMTHLQEGNLPSARAVLEGAPAEVEPTALVAFVSNFWDLGWVLGADQRQLLRRLTPSAYDGDRATWAHALTQEYALGHDEPNTGKYAELARAGIAEQLAAAPEDAWRHTFLGLSLAYLGRKAEAIREAERGVELLPVSRDAYNGGYIQHQLVRVYILTGEHEKALDRLEELLETPYYLSPGWLRIDPNFDPLRGNPRFEKLAAGAS